jgi:hypothetical protein
MPTRTHRRTALLLVGAFLVASFPAHFVPLKTGTDPSFWYGLNALADSSYLHGRDVVFPYGPLGFLLVPLDVHHHVVLGLVMWTLLHLALGALLLRRASRPGGTAPVVVFGLLYLMAIALGLLFQYRVVLLIGLLVGESLQEQRRPSVFAAAAGVLTGLGLLTKFGLGLAGVLLLGAGELVRAVKQRPPSLRAPAAAAAGSAGPLLLLGLPAFGRVAGMKLWLHDSLELASGYGAAMSLPAYWQGVLAGVLCLTLFAAVAVALAVRRAPGLAWASIFLLPLLLAFKHGFVRQDGHIQNFFSFLVAVLAVLALNARTARGLAMPAVAAGLVAVLALGAYRQGGFFYPVSRVRAATGLTGAGNLAAALQMGSTRARLGEEGAANLERARLPPLWLDDLSGAGVGVFPTEISYIPANGLSWVPGPALQTYGAYTAPLDERSAAHYAGSMAPDFVLFEYRSIDLRHPFLDPPASVRSILQHFDLGREDLPAGRLLLQRSEPRFRYPAGQPVEEQGRMGDWVAVPESDALLYAELHFHMTAAGRARKLAFRVPPVSMEVEYRSGVVASFRILPETTGGGLLLNYLPRSLEEAALLWKGQARDQVVRFRVGGSGAFSYDLTFRIRWNATDYTIIPEGAPEENHG